MGKQETIAGIVQSFHADATRLLDIFWSIQEKLGFVSDDALGQLSPLLNLSVLQLRDTLSFYHFFHNKFAGRIKIYLDTSAIAGISGLSEVVRAFESALGCKLGHVDASGQFGLFPTPCIGMSDQSPSALIDGLPVGNLTPEGVCQLVADLRKGRAPEYSVSNQVHRKGGVILGPHTAPGHSLKHLIKHTPESLISSIRESGLRGRGGAGFPTGQKWGLCAVEKADQKYVICNADEGEPGTFKDRFLLTKMPGLVLEGMVVGARAIGASQGIIYVRAEYRYLVGILSRNIRRMEEERLLGKDILGIRGFDFHIRIQVGAGAYVVGEETALLESLEGKRGEPRVRPPFPVQEGYQGKPTVVNNVETFASVARIIEFGAPWYRQFGTETSPGTKLLSVSGDCKKPGIYEVEWGISIGSLLDMAGAENTMAVQVGGPSGICLDARQRHRTVAFEDLATGGSMMIFNHKRNLLRIIREFMQFFADESCGCCVPCRAGTTVLNEMMDHILSGEAAMIDLDRIRSWSKIVSPGSRCGLGQTCTNPVLSSMDHFPELYKSRVNTYESLYRPFDIAAKTKAYEQVARIHGK